MVAETPFAPPMVAGNVVPMFGAPRAADPSLTPAPFAPPTTTAVVLDRAVWQLSGEHVELGREHAVKPEVLGEHCYTDPMTGRLTFVWDDGDRQVAQQRLSEAERREDGPKYLFPKDSGKILNHLRIGEPDAPLLLVEGSFQSLAALSWAPRDYGIVAMAGCANHDLPSLLKVAEGREVTVFLDADAVENPDVWFLGYKRLKATLDQAGASKIRYHESTGSKKAGLDDDLAAIPEDKRHDVIGRMVAGAQPRLNKPKPRKLEAVDGGDVLSLTSARPSPSLAPDGSLRVQLNSEEDAYHWLRNHLPTVETFFQRGNQVVHMVTASHEDYVQPEEGSEVEPPEWYRQARNGMRQVAPLGLHSLHARIQAENSFEKWNGTTGTYSPIMFPINAVGPVVNDPEPVKGLRQLRGIVTSPVFLRDGRILQEPGYDRASGFYYEPDQTLTGMRPVSDNPAPEEFAEARWWLDLLMWDFPFTSPDARATYAGYLFLPMLKDLVPPPYKMLGITAPTKGSGKGYLSSGLRIIHHGRHGGVLKGGIPEREEERRKYISTILSVTAGDMVIFDNVKSVVQGQALEFLMTNIVWNDRELGSNRSIHEVNDRVWVANGNNLQLGGDMGRRVALAEIDTGMENPQDRTEYRIKAETGLHFLDFVTQRRGDLLWALLTLTRGWYLAGGQRPTEDTSDDYSVATATLRGLLTFAGLQGAGTFDSKTLRATGEEDDSWGRFLLGAHEWQRETKASTDGWWTADQLATECAGVGKWDVDLSDIPEMGDDHLPKPRKVAARIAKVGKRPAAGLQVFRKVDRKDKPWFTIQPLRT